MTVPVVDSEFSERTALLSRTTSATQDEQGRPESGSTPLPMGQLSILFFLRFCESASTFAIYPFLEKLLKSVIEGDEAEVGYYAGIMDMTRHSISLVAVLYWSRMSDKIGRKPILLLGTAFLSLSMLCFGLSKHFWMLVLSRCLANAFSSSAGTIKSMIGELTDSTNSADAFALLHAPWAAGSSFGAFVGGWLAGPQPYFEMSRTYPYFLPCAAMACLTASGFFITATGLRETLSKRPVPSPTRGATPPIESNTPEGDTGVDEVKSASLRQLITNTTVLIPLLNYTTLSFLQNCSNTILPLYLALPIRLGGLGMRPASIGTILSIYGATNSVFQALFLGRLVKWFGVKKVFLSSISASVPLYAMYAINNIIEKRTTGNVYGRAMTGVSTATYCRVAIQLSFAMVMECGYGCVYMFITAASPNRQSLGSTNGIAQTMVSIIRVICAPFAGSLLSYSIQSQWVWGYGVYLTMASIGLLFLLVARRLPDQISY